jgi:hypothetical protein
MTSSLDLYFPLLFKLSLLSIHCVSLSLSLLSDLKRAQVPCSMAHINLSAVCTKLVSNESSEQVESRIELIASESVRPTSSPQTLE